MQTILIIYPHWHPANLAGVQRPRLIGNYLKELGWKPRVLTVKEEYFEEKPDRDFHKIFSNDFEVTRVDALPANKSQKKKTKGFLFLRILYSLLTAHYSIRLIGDIGLRAFFQLYKEAKHIIRTEKIDFIWLPIPSFYNALLGRLLYEKTKVPYGIDYIDPWVRDLSNQKNRRAILSQWVARKLEPIAIKKASIISGVSTPYYAPAIQRNFPSIANVLLNSNSNDLSTYRSNDLNSNSTLNSQLLNSSTIKLLNSSTPQLLNSSTPQLLNSSTPQLNPHTNKPFTHVAMPYGFDPNDHKIKLEEIEYPWNNEQLSVSNDQLENGEGNRESKERRAKSEEQRAKSGEQKMAQGIDNDSKQLTEVGDGNKLKNHHSPLTSHNSELITPSSSKASAKKKSITQLLKYSNTQPNDLITSYPNDLTTSGSNDLHKTWLYAGAFLPNSHVLMDAFFQAIAELRKEGKWDKNIQLWFIGTGPYPAKRITAYAKDHEIEDIVFENRDRYPFLHILNFLSAADTVMVIGSTEKHYTASKTYQSILSERPVISIFHHESSAVKVMEDCHADQFTVRYNPEMHQEDIVSAFKETLLKRLETEDWNPDYSALDQYSAKESARKLVKAIEAVL